MAQVGRYKEVVDLKGMDLEVLQGLSPERLPMWVVIEEDSGDQRARIELTLLGYSCLSKGLNIAFQREIVQA
jgi:hypothetical protein